jgi:hypothetical protein
MIAGALTLQQINFCFYTSDVAESKGAFVLCDVTCLLATIGLLWCEDFINKCKRRGAVEDLNP